MYRGFERFFRRHPISVPIGMLIAGAGALFLGLARTHAGFVGLGIGYLIGGGAMVAILGLLLLPFGVVMTAKRRAHPITVTCPRCHLRSQDAAEPFAIIRESYLDYVHVTCSSCRADFTLPAEARLL
jgi:hypothetical protein